MYTVVFPKNHHIRPSEQVSLKDAIKTKLALAINRPNSEGAVILDKDGYIMSTREQNLYIIQNLV